LTRSQGIFCSSQDEGGAHYRRTRMPQWV
jgi:hypothetical protein